MIKTLKNIFVLLMPRMRWGLFTLALLGTVWCCSTTKADPCGMVPPIYTGQGSPITRIGLQQTYVFFDDGVESFVIRPGFQGKVDNFGMLIPFPSPPSLRKVPDNVFEQIAAAVDPPEVIVDLNPVPMMAFGAVNEAEEDGMDFDGLTLLKNEVRVLKEEAVGMYEVAVLEAGSPEALQRWMDQNKFVYPSGMDDVTLDYINEGWCFVAVKTKVGAKSDADPKPGQRNANPQMPDGSVFDGNVQGLGFRFKTEKLVVPMRLSAFNEGDMRNIVYLLTRGGKRIDAIPEEYVQRQIPGVELVRNLTQPLPMRIIGGNEADIPEYRLETLPQERDPAPHNGVAKHLFTSDLRAMKSPDLSLAHEETEKELLRIGEHLGLRGSEIDAENAEIVNELSDEKLKTAFPGLRKMTLTVVDGDFPRDVVAKQNLTFSDFRLAQNLNRPRRYDTKLHGPAPVRKGRRVSSMELRSIIDLQIAAEENINEVKPLQSNPVRATVTWAGILLIGAFFWRRRQEHTST